ncbi:16758_t:CDS:2 [Funneliformis caledonium]|uniref:16758_t:CDS:1 n=1 Tax=Funneliformis caledonium TaxID=1117310 RepID=A0A9N9FX41_9GLOM|nr:16758_t:CDS:2 [Funneliformis caledonium]
MIYFHFSHFKIPSSYNNILAGITTNSPFQSVTWNGGEQENVVWADDGKAPALSKIGQVTIDLMAGGEENQVLVDNIGKAPATAKTISYKVPVTVGPPGDFYFIKYTSGSYISYSGTFSIEGVKGTVNGFDPKNPNAKSPANGTTINSLPTYSTYPKIGQASPTQSNAPTGSPAIPATKNNDAPKTNPIDADKTGDAISLMPSFVGIATSAIALTLTYLY